MLEKCNTHELFQVTEYAQKIGLLVLRLITSEPCSNVYKAYIYFRRLNKQVSCLFSERIIVLAWRLLSQVSRNKQLWGQTICVVGVDTHVSME